MASEESDLRKLRRQFEAHVRLLAEYGVDSVPRIERQVSDVREMEADSVVPETSPPRAAPITSSLAQVSPEQNLLFEDLMLPTTVPVALGSPGEGLVAIRADLGDCQRCKLCHHRANIVFGEGNPKAALVFVGEAPGADEDATGRPFVGRAGQLLTKIIESIDIKREDCYICNILKCRPPGNRDPEKDEVAACESFLFRQIASIQPRLIVALGTHGAQTLLRTKEPISKLRGRFHDYRGTKLLATFHPAYLLRDPNRKKDTWEDMKKVRDFLGGAL